MTSDMAKIDLPSTIQHLWLSDTGVFARFTSGTFRKENTASTVCLNYLNPK